MSEYTWECAGCAARRRTTDTPGWCERCTAVIDALPGFLKSRTGRLHAHTLVMQAEIAAGCEQSLKMNTLASTVLSRPPAV